MKPTKHGHARLKERTGIRSPEFLRTVLEKGRATADFAGSFRRYLDKQACKGGTRVVVYGHFIYLFGHAQKLVTVLDVPPRFRGHLRKKEGEI